MVVGCTIYIIGLVLFLFGFIWWLIEIIANKCHDSKYLIANIILCNGALIVNIGNFIIKRYS